MAPITVGDSIPEGTRAWSDQNNQLQQLSIHSLAQGKKVILFGVPSAFTPTSSMQHVPGFISKPEELKSKGVDESSLLAIFCRYFVEGKGLITYVPRYHHLLDCCTIAEYWC